MRDSTDDPTWQVLQAARQPALQLARALVRDQHAAEDLAHDALLAGVQRGLAVLRDPSAWLRGTVRHLARRLRRGEARRRAREVALAPAESTPPAEEALEAARLQRCVVDAVLGLPEPYRATVLLRFWEGLPPRTIAARHGVPVATVRTRLQRALEQLRGRLDRDAGGRTAWLALAWSSVRSARSSSKVAAFSSARVAPGRGLRASAVGQGVLMSCVLIAMIIAGFGSAGWTVPEASIAAVVPVAVAVESGRAADAAPVRGLVDASPQNGGAPVGEPSHPSSGDGFAPTPLRVQVVDLSGAKVPGALVELFPPELAALPEGMSPRDLLAAHLRGQLVRAADADRVLVAGRTAADGACVLTIPRARVRLVATTAAASSGWVDVDTLVAARLPELQVCLTPVCRVQGRVLDRDGAPREGVTVELSSVGGSASFRPCEPVPAKTDADGRFALTCGPAEWRVGVRELATETHRFAAFPGGFVEVVLRELGTTSVQVELRGTAAEAADAHVWARLDGDAGQVFAGRCVEPTRWVVALPGAGSYTLHAAVEGVAVAVPVAALLGPNDRLVPVTISLAPLQAIRGVVVAADGQPLRGALLMCCEDLGAAGVTRCRGGAARDDGTFEFDGLDPSRRYRISCRASAASDVFAVRRAVAPGSRLRLVDAPSERADLSLQVVDAATGRPLARAGVRVLSERGGQFKLHAQTYDGDEYGVVIVPNVAVGDEVAVAVEVEGFAPSTLAVTCGAAAVATRVPMARPGNVAIEVLNADGTPAVAADVRLTSRLPASWRFAFGWLPGARRTNGDGRQQWDGLAPGTYDVHADGGPRRGTAVGEVEVRAGAPARVTLRLPRE